MRRRAVLQQLRAGRRLADLALRSPFGAAHKSAGEAVGRVSMDEAARRIGDQFIQTLPHARALAMRLEAMGPGSAAIWWP